MGRKRNSVPPIQLYSLTRDLVSQVQNQGQSGRIIAASIGGVALEFSSRSSSADQIKHEQMRAIYGQLGKVLDYGRKFEGSNLGFYVICEFAHPLEEKVKKLLDIRTPPSIDDCLRGIDPDSASLIHPFLRASESHQRDYEDFLRRTGRNLIRDILDAGERLRKVDALNQDYDLVLRAIQ